MTDILRRLNPAITLVALFISLLALMAAAAGVGYAAATIGTADLKNNAVTAKKIKNNAVKTKKIKNNAVTGDKVKDNTLTASDLVAEEMQKPATFSNGGEGDCLWQSGATLIAGLGGPTYRKDRFGTVHLDGVAVVSDGPGGDGDCDNSAVGQADDAIMLILPAGYIPAKTTIAGDLSGPGVVVIAGAQGVNSGGLVLPPGAVATGSTAAGGGIVLDGISFEPAGSPVVLPKSTGSGHYKGDLGALLGLG